MTKRNLYNWWVNDAISGRERNRLVLLGVDNDQNSINVYTLEDLRELLRCWSRCPINTSNRLSLNILDPIQQMNFFPVWWNNNLITINGNGSFGINFLVHETSLQSMPRILEKFEISTDVYNQHRLNETRNKVRDLETILSSNNPILYRGNSLQLNYPSPIDINLHFNSHSLIKEVKKIEYQKREAFQIQPAYDGTISSKK